MHIYFSLGCVAIFFVTLFKTIEKLKIAALAGIVMLAYLVVCFLFMTPRYYEYYNNLNLLHMTPFTFSTYMFKAFGTVSYMFLNQYTIMPICAGTVRVSMPRMSKILQRALTTIFSIYILILSAGYFS